MGVCDLPKKSFIHLSDIHFVKSSNKPDDIDQDLRKAILTDLKRNAKNTLENVAGILVTGDIAYSGKEDEYNIAKDFLNEICNIFDISHSDVYCVPGNHDIDQESIVKSAFIPQAQKSIVCSSTIDDADKEFSKYIHPDNQSVLFIPFENYNNFASLFECNISCEEIFWQKKFQLEDDFYIRIIGINSSFISTKDDSKTNKLMHIGQAQIPDYYDNTATLLMCHHPPECWQFKKDIVKRINKRADVQLYGHMHSQSLDITDDNVILYSGAVHPTRTVDWLPRYNWISVESKVNGEKILKIEIFPRCLSEDRDSFEIDKVCGLGKKSIIHEINIDKKRRANLEDSERLCCFDIYDNEDINQLMLIPDTTYPKISERDLKYNFYNLGWLKQIGVLMQLNLIKESETSKPMQTLLKTAINIAKEQNKIEDFYKKVLNEINLEVK